MKENGTDSFKLTFDEIEKIAGLPIDHSFLNYKKELLGNVLSCDLFSTYNTGDPIGTEEYLLIDTETWEYEEIK